MLPEWTPCSLCVSNTPKALAPGLFGPGAVTNHW